MNINYTIDKYDDKNMEFEDWAEDFRSLAIMTQCPDDKAKHLIRLFLDETGKAALKKLTQAETATTDSLIAGLKRELTPTFLQDEAQDSLEHLRRGKLPIEYYGRVIAKTVSLAYPSLNNDDTDRMSKKYFIRGLDSELCQRVEISNPINFQKTILNALHQERYLTIQRNEKKNQNSKQELMKLVQTNFRNFQQIKSNQNSSTKQNQKKQCQLCQSTKHEALKCKQSPVTISAGKFGPKSSSPSPVTPSLTNISEKKIKLEHLEEGGYFGGIYTIPTVWDMKGNFSRTKKLWQPKITADSDDNADRAFVKAYDNLIAESNFYQNIRAGKDEKFKKPIKAFELKNNVEKLQDISDISAILSVTREKLPSKTEELTSTTIVKTTPPLEPCQNRPTICCEPLTGLPLSLKLDAKSSVLSCENTLKNCKTSEPKTLLQEPVVETNSAIEMIDSFKTENYKIIWDKKKITLPEKKMFVLQNKNYHLNLLENSRVKSANNQRFLSCSLIITKEIAGKKININQNYMFSIIKAESSYIKRYPP